MLGLGQAGDLARWILCPLSKELKTEGEWWTCDERSDEQEELAYRMEKY